MPDEGKYVARPIGVEAIQLKRGNLKAVETFLAGREMPDFFVREKGWNINWGNSHVWINTIDGKRTATPGMWIVRDAKGQLFIFRDDVFHSRFEKE